MLVAGAAGFEPAVTGPKPVALPLGYAPWNNTGGTIRPNARAPQRGSVRDQALARAMKEIVPGRGHSRGRPGPASPFKQG